MRILNPIMWCEHFSHSSDVARSAVPLSKVLYNGLPRGTHKKHCIDPGVSYKSNTDLSGGHPSIFLRSVILCISSILV